MKRVNVLCVDDERAVLDGLELSLRKKYQIDTATSGQEGLQRVEQDGPFAVVVSDMRMPHMDGATFLSKVRQVAPDTVRVLLTGHADFDAAIAAINDGQIFRFLTKPCPAEQLRKVVALAVEQHRLVTAERVLLEQTLHGSVRTITDILALANPKAFGRATRLKTYVRELADAVQLDQQWTVEVATMLSQLGCITLPTETLDRVYYGQRLSEKEQQMVERLPAVAEQLLAPIPRLEGVREILATQDVPFHAATKSPNGRSGQPIGARILKIAKAYDELEARGMPPALAINALRSQAGEYDPVLLDAFANLRGTAHQRQRIKELPLRHLRVGMVLAEDVRTPTGALLVARGYEITHSFIERARNFKDEIAGLPVRVIVPQERDKTC